MDDPGREPRGYVGSPEGLEKFEQVCPSRGQREHMKAPYSDRREAGELLAAYVAPLVNGPAVVAAIPRGGVAG